MSRLASSIIAVSLLFLILLIDGVSSVAAQTDPAQPTSPPIAPTASNELILLEAQQANNQAASLMNVINTFAAILGVVGVVLAVVAAVGAYSGIMTNRELRQQAGDVRNLVSEAQKIKTDVEKIEAMKTELETLLLDLEKSKDLITRDVMKRSQNITQAIALTLWAQRQIGIGNLESAVKLLEQACELDDQIIVTQYFLGDVYVRLGNLDKGVFYLQKARQDFQFPSADASYAYTLRLRGDQSKGNQREIYYTEATNIFLRVYEIEPQLLDAGGESVFGALGGLYRRQERFRDAIYWYEHAHSVTRFSSYPVNNLAILNFRAGNKAEAEKYFHQAYEMAMEKLNLRSSDYWAQFDLITAKVALGQPFDEILPDLDKGFKSLIDPGPLRKFLDGLDDLNTVEPPPPAVAEVIQAVQDKIKELDAAKSAATPE